MGARFVKKDKYDRMSTQRLSEHVYRRILAPLSLGYELDMSNDADRHLVEGKLIDRRFAVAYVRYRNRAGMRRIDCRVARRRKFGESVSKTCQGRALAIAALRCLDNEG